MSLASQSTSLTSTQSPSPNLVKICEIFKIDPTYGDLKQRCFDVVFRACEAGNWGDVRRARPYLLGLTDLANRSVMEVCIDEEKVDLIKRAYEEMDKDGKTDGLPLVDLLSNDKANFLHRAAKKGKVEAFRVLAPNRNVNEGDAKGRTPLHLMLTRGHTNILKAIQEDEQNLKQLENGDCIQKEKFFVGDLMYCEKVGCYMPPVLYAAYSENIDALDILITFEDSYINRKINAPNNKALHLGSILHLLIFYHRNKILFKLLNEHLEKVQSLLNELNNEGLTPLMLAAALGNLPAISLLIAKGAQTTARGDHGRTAMHHAILNYRKDAILLLSSRCNKIINIADKYGNFPINLIGGNDNLSRSIREVVIRCMGKTTQQYTPPNFKVELPETIVFQGGGPKGAGYCTAIQVLEERSLTGELKRVAGTSAGAITACLLAIGNTGSEIQDKVENTSFGYFLDHYGTQEQIFKFIDKVLEPRLLPLLGVARSCIATMSPMPLLLHLTANFVRCVKEEADTFTGLCSGDRFREWIDEEIRQKTTTQNCTFGEYQKLVREEPGKYRHIHVFATQVYPEIKIVHFSSEDLGSDKKYCELIMSSAVTASMAIPGVYQAQILRFKSKDGNIYAANSLERYIDGGLLYNFPLEEFDKRKYIEPGVTGDEGEYPMFNRRALGFSLYSPEPKEQKIVTKEITPGTLIWNIMKIYSDAEVQIRKRNGTYNVHRVIDIDTKGVALYDFRLNLKQGKGKELLDGAREVTAQFLDRQKAEFNEFLALSLKVRQDLKEVQSSLETQSTSKAPPSLLTAEASKPTETTLALPKSEKHERDMSASMRVCRSSTLIISYIGVKNITWNADYKAAVDKKFQLYAMANSDERFVLFEHLYYNRIGLADQVFRGHEAFFRSAAFSVWMPQVASANMRLYISYLSDKKVPVNVEVAKGEDEKWPLIHTIVPFDVHEALEALLTAFDYQDFKGPKGQTLLHLIAKHKRYGAYDRLEKHKKVESLINEENKSRKTAVLIAGQKHDMPMVQKLLSQPGVKVTGAHPKSKKTLLHYIAESSSQKSAQENFEKVIEVAKGSGSLNTLVEEENRCEESILFKTQNRTMLKHLIEIGIDLTRKKDNNYTLLYQLAKNGDEELVLLFCQKLKERHPDQFLSILNAEVDSAAKCKKTALIIAIQKKHDRVVKLLIEQGANFISSVSDKTPMSYAYKGAAQILRNAYLGKVDRPFTGQEKIHCLDYCCEQGDFESAKQLITNKVVTSPIGAERNERGYGLLLIVMRSNFREDQKHLLVKLLLDGEYKDDVNQKSNSGNTPLMWAAVNRYEFIIIDLVKMAEIKINEKDALGGTALHDAVRNYKSNNGDDRTGYIRAILSHKDIDPNLRNDKGETPLHLTKDLKVAELLVRKGANQNVKDSNGNIPDIVKKSPIRPNLDKEPITTFQQFLEQLDSLDKLLEDLKAENLLLKRRLSVSSLKKELASPTPITPYMPFMRRAFKPKEEKLKQACQLFIELKSAKLPVISIYFSTIYNKQYFGVREKLQQTCIKENFKFDEL